MTSTALKSLLKAQPFAPFKIVVSSGYKYAVRHPEMVLILRDRALVAQASAARNGLPDDYVTLAYLHIAAVEPLPTNGRASRTRRKM